MLITTKAVYDIDGNLLEWEGYEYDGAVELCKGGASKAEQAAADTVRSNEYDLMKQSLAQQGGYLAPVDKITQQIIDNGGLLPKTESALNTIALNQSGANYAQGIGNINNAMVAKGLVGGQNAGGGGFARDFGQFQAMQNALQSKLLSDVQLQKSQGMQQALNTRIGLGQVTGQNIGMFNSGVSNSLNAGVNAAHNVDQAGTGLWGSILGGALGLGSSIATGGMSNLGKGVGFFGGGAGAGGGGV